ncbi:MAG: M15 family metallopeptidase [Steroidobacteraceae bacterium]
MTPEQLTGRSAEHIVELSQPRCLLHAGIESGFLEMHRAARRAGIELTPASSFRSFERQLTIWNEKFDGIRPVLGADGEPVDVGALDEEARVRAILLWSALPGASRHHWGTDLDLIDRAALPEGYRVQLIGAEFGRGGIFERLHDWLLRHAEEFGFFKPYRGVLSAVASEPWHWSHAQIAERARAQLTPEILLEALESSPVLGLAVLRGKLGELHAAYVRNIDPPPALA